MITTYITVTISYKRSGVVFQDAFKYVSQIFARLVVCVIRIFATPDVTVIQFVEWSPSPIRIASPDKVTGRKPGFAFNIAPAVNGIL